MAFYCFLVFFIIALFCVVYYHPNLDKIIGSFILVVLIVIGGLRDRIGWDYFHYKEWYLEGTRDDGKHALEFGFLALLKLFRYLQIDYNFLLFFMATLTYFFVYLGLRNYSNNITLPLVLYVLIPVMFLYSFTFIRQYLAVGISFYAFSLLLDKKYILFFMLMLLGISFHYSCVIALVIFITAYVWIDRVKWIHMYIMLGVSFLISQIGIISILRLFFIDSHYLFYVDVESVSVPYLKLAIFNIVGLAVIGFYHKYGFENSKQKYLLLLYICAISVLNIFSESLELTRIYVYFRIFEIVVLVPIIYFSIEKRKTVLLCLLLAFYVGPFFRAIIIDSHSPILNEIKLVPYKTLLFKNDSIT